MQMWSDVVEGTATGPTRTIEAAEGTITVTALWSDAEGVGVTVDIPPDAFFRPFVMAAMCRAVTELSALPAPALVAA